jgi:hypothetical protein
MLGVEQVADADDLFIANHASPREKGSPSAPGGRKSDRRPSRSGRRRPRRGGGPTPGWPRSAHKEAPVHTGRDTQGRFIRHAGALALPILALAVAMV